MNDRGDQTATVAFVRPALVPAPTVATAEIAVAAPPQPPRSAGGSLLTRLLPVAMAAAMVPMMTVVYRSGSSVAGSPAFLIFPLLMLGSAVVSAVTGRGRRHGSDIDADRDDYLDYLTELRDSVTNTAVAQRLSLTWQHPAPEALWTLAGGPRMWERQPGHAEFGRLRVGAGPVGLATRLVPPPTGRAGPVDPVTDTALRRFLAAHSEIPAAPIAIAVFALAALTLDGDRSSARGLLRAMICQLAVLHGPDSVLIAAVVADRSREHWEWLKWLPHHVRPDTVDDAGPARLMYPTLAAAEPVLAALPAGRHAVVVVDGGGHNLVDGAAPAFADGGVAGITIVEVGAGCARLAAGAGLQLRVTAAALVARTGHGQQLLGRPDQLEPIDALVCARRLAGYRVGGSAAGGRTHWLDLIGIGDIVAFTPNTLWDRVKAQDTLRIPIGSSESGAAVHLDIKEAAAGGMGPHGLCIGATGSGKSELLRTIVLGMMARHSPEAVNLVLVDFKGGATFVGMEQADHVAAVITNLADEAPLVARMRDALLGELNRRQELLRAAGNFTHAAAYQDARRAGAPLTPLPTLLVIVDEFAELLSQQPDFVDIFVAIGRLGRSLGIHLLLASQRLEEGRLRGLESHLSYRICLKTLSAGESRTVLGVPDAYQLPNDPGLGYLRAGSGELIGFQAALVSGPCPAFVPAAAPSTVQPFTAAPHGPARPVSDPPASGRTVLEVALEQLSGQGPAARKVWLPPLDASPALGRLLGEGPHDPGADGDLVVPIGIVDRPFEQCRTTMLVDLRGAAGNVAVVGAPQSGKSTALATLVTALAASHDAAWVQLYCLDFGGGALAALRSLPQVGSVAARTDTELVRRTVREMESILTRREMLFRDHGIGSMNRYRQLRARRDPVGAVDRFGDVFLVIDGWAALCRDFDALEASIVALAGRGLSFGVHVVVSASRWAELRPGLRDQIGTRIELRLGDPADSELDRSQAARVPRDRPGRALTEGGLHALIALPRLDGMEPVRSADIAAPPVPLLPTLVCRQSLLELSDDAGKQPLLGVEETGLETVAIDFSRQPHLLIFGDNECGKTSALRLLCCELVRTHTAGQAQLIVVDYRRSLLGVVGGPHLGGYAMSAATVTVLLPKLLARLAQRMPGPEVTQQQLRDRSWWSGPEFYLLVDDYDLVATAAGNPLTPLLEYLPHAGDLGLHLVVARRSGGAARAVYEPLLAALRDLGCMGLTMSGDPDEGPLIGSARPVWLPAGRGTLVTRAGGAQLIQLAWSPPP